MPILPNNDLDYIDEESEDITSEDMTDGSNVTENNATYNDPFDYNGPADIGVPDSLPVDPVVPESSEDRYYVTYYNRGDLTDYEPAYLQELAEAGCKFYAIYDDETEVEIQWTEIEDLDPLETEIDISASIAAAANQHFWDDTNGVHVAEVAKEDWQEALEAEFSDLSSSKNYYNILMNSLGLLLRRANFILTSINRASISFYDGLGNETTNIMASFGRNSAQIGRSNDKHVIIDNSGLTAYNSDGTLAPLTGTFDGANINNSSITNAKIVDGTIEGTKIASATIDNSNIKNGTIEGTKIASATIDNSNIKNGTITGAKIADGTIENTDIKNGTITGAKIASATIENSNIKDGTIQGSKIIGSTLTGIPYAGISDADIEVARVANAEIAKAEVNYAHITNGVIDNAKIDHADVNGLSANYATVANLNAATARIGSLEAADVTINGRIDATEADIDDLEAEDARIGNLVAQKASITDLNAATARIDDLEADHVSVEDFEAEQANIDTLQANTADIATIRANSAKVQNLTAAQLEADHATVGSLSTTYATITNLNAATGRISDLESTRVRTTDLEANYITADTIEANYTKTDLSNTDVAWIQNGTIKDGAISNAMIGSLSASKLTAGTINGNTITVTNLNADNITAGTLNGQRIGEGSLSLSKLEEDVYTESEVDSIVSNLQTQIDGAIETWTGTAVPTLNNSPANGWTTNAVKDTHVGDVYFVVNSNSQQNGYNYRFTKSGSTYSWQLIKDSDVTNALQRLSTAEGKITTFDSDISQLKTDTGTLTTKTTSLETRMSNAESDILDKVDTTTFNEVSDTVDSHSQSITQMSTTLSNKADSSTVTAVTNRVSKTEQDISGINTTIGTMQTTLASKADGSTVETMSTKLNTVSDTVDGHTQSISSINSTLSTKADNSTVSTLSTKVNTIEDTVDGHTQSLQSVTSTQTSIQQNAVKSTVQLWFTKANTTAPNKPTAHVTTNNAATGNAWNLAVPTYNDSYPNYYYCYEYQYLDGSYGWSAVTRDIATGEMQATARQAKADIDGLEIGGRNLLPITKFILVAAGPDNITQDGWITDSTNTSDGRVGTYAASNWKNISLSAGQYVLSWEVSASTSNQYQKILIRKSDETFVWSTTDASGPFSSIGIRSHALIFDEDVVIGILIKVYSAIVRFKLERGNKSTDWTPAPEDVDADISTAQTSADNAQAIADKNVKESVQLWFTKANGSAPNKPTSAVTSTSTSGNAWTTKVPTYSASYPHYFYCMQYKLADGTYTWSDVVYDQATTEAQSVARTTSTNLSTLQQDYATFKQTTQNFESTIGTTYATKTEVSAVDDKIDNLEIGGRNLVRWSTSPEYKGGNVGKSSDSTGWYAWSTSTTGVVDTDEGIKCIFTGNFTGLVIPLVYDNAVLGDEVLTISFDYRGTLEAVASLYLLTRSGGNVTQSGSTPPRLIVSETNWQHYEYTFRFSSLGNRGATHSILLPYTTSNGKWFEIKDRSFKLEKGDKATGWTPAPEDVDAGIAAVPRMARINAPSSNFTMAQWNTFGSMGYSANWSTGASYNNSHLRIGDRAYLTGTISDKNGGTVTIIGEVTKVQPEGSGTSYVAMKSEQLIFGGDVVSAIESRVSSAETSITQTNQQIALKANASDVYTKTQTDGLISTEVSNRNSAIEQSAAAINLSVSETYTTKTEFNALEIGGKNLLRWTGDPRIHVGTNAHTDANHAWAVQSGGNGVGSIAEIDDSPVYGLPYTFRITDNTSGNRDWQQRVEDFSTLGVDGEWIFSAYVRGIDGNVTYLVRVWSGEQNFGKTGIIGTTWTKLEIPIKLSGNIGSASGSASPNMLIGLTGAGSIEYVAPKLERGNRATDWTPAPEDGDATFKQVLMQPNLSPFFASHNIDGTYPVGDADGYWQPTADGQYNRSFFTAMEDGWVHINIASNNGTMKEFVPPRVDSLVSDDKVTFLLEWRNVQADPKANFYTRNYPNNVQLHANYYFGPKITAGSGEHYWTMTVNSTADGSQAWNGLVDLTFPTNGGAFVGDIRISAYKGEYNSPYKPYNGTLLYTTNAAFESAKSEIKATTDGITSTVSKISSAKYLTSAYLSSGWTLANIRNYAAEGSMQTFTVVSTEDVRVGDTVYIKGKDSTRVCNVYIKGTVTQVVNATQLVMTSHGYEDVLPVDTIKSTINQSSDSVKIQAKHVEIDGAAIFSNSAFKTAADAAYDAKGSAATAKSEAISAAASDATSKANAVNSSLESYKTTVNSTLSSLQNQVDGQIEAWYKSVDPTASNEPASAWTTAELKQRHEGDLYYNINNGHSWRWLNNGGTYSWQQIPDSDAAAALAAAQNAQTSANTKRRIFTTTPTVPYDVGDLWVNGAQIKYANASRNSTQSYTASDWVLTATDDSNIPTNVSELTNDANYGTTSQIATAKSEAISTASSDATSKANAAEANAKGYADEQASEAYEKIRSQGIQLVTNGNGFMGDNTNFSWWTFDGSKSNGSPGSFTHAPYATTVATDEMFPVDTAKDYMVEFDTLSTGSGAHPQLYAMLLFYDVDKKPMNIQQVSYIIGSTTTLARELKNGDTVIYLTDASGFIDTSAAHQRSLIFWDYTNSFGYTYPPETYSRNFYAPSGGLWSDYSKINKSSNTITLTTAWTGGTKPAGTYLSQNSSGSTYVYFWYRTGTSFPLDEWTHASGIYSGFQTGIANVAGKFYKGCSYCKIGWLWNCQNSSSNPQKQIWITNVSVKEAVATKAELNSVATTANNAAPKSSAIARTQRIYWRATSNTKPSANTTWLTTSGDGYGNWSLNVPQLTKGSTKYPYLFTAVQTQTVAQQAAGSTCSCSAVTIDDSTTVIDGGKIITGSVNANAINASSGTFDTANIPDLNASKITSGSISADRIKANVINAVNNGTGTINADKINASNLTIGYSQINNPPTIPSKVSDLTNDSGFQTSSQVNTAITSKGYATTTQAQGYANTAKSEAISAAATDATNKANAVQTNLDNLEIGGRNLLRYRIYNYADASNAIAVGSSYRGMYCAIDGGETYTISRKTIEGNRFWIEWSEQEPSSGVSLHVLSNNNTAMKVTVNTPSEANWLFIYLSNQGDEIHDGNIKIERGTKATDWTPAPEDVDADISLAIEQAKAPIDSKTYTGIIGTANSFAGANFFFGKLYPDNYNKGWQAKLRIECEAPDTYQQSLDITFGGYGSTFSSYDSVTSLSSARAFYYFELFRATSTGINVNVGHMLGISLQSATNPTNSSYARTIRVDILEVTNCTIELNNTAVAYTSMAGYSVENYGDGTTNLTQMSVAAAGQNATNNTNTNDTARYVQFYNTIVAGEALVKESLIGGHEDGKFYQISGANDYFMLSQPLLWTTIALNANATNYANIYTQCYDRNLATYYTAFANTLANKIVYLVGTIDGNKFTIYGSASNQYLTVTEPTTADGRFYIPLGRLGNQSNGKNYFNFQVSYPVALYAYLDGKFRQVTPTEVVAEQYIYCSAVSGTNSMAKYETWVEPPTSVTASTQNSWTIKRPEYSSSYPVLFVAKQTKRLDGTVTCTTPVKDDTTTIIDGGHITTGTIDASVVTVTNLDASEIKSGTIDADRIDVSAISIGSLNGASDYATKSDAQGYANAKDAAIAAAAKRTDVSIAVTAINYDLGTATLQATLYVDGTATTSNVTYKWLKDGSVISGQTARTLSVTAAMGLSHVYSCTVTYS